MHQCIPLDAPTDWKKALSGIQHAFAHTWENCYAMHISSGTKTYLYCFETEKVRIVCPISERPWGEYIDIVTPYGFSGFVGNDDCDEFPYHWKKFVRDKEYVCGYIGLNPIFENCTYYKPDQIHQYNSIYVLDLTLSPSELFANLSTNRKRQLKDWEKSLANIVLDKEILTEFFLANYHAFYQSRRASPVYNFSRDTLSFLASLDNVVMVGMRGSEKMEAVSVFAHTPDVGEFLFNVSLPEGQRYSATLIWYGVNYLKSLQIPLLNLGGGIREGDGVAQFKERFGAKKLALKCLKQVYEPEIYVDLCRQVNADPNDMTGYFPSYRKPDVSRIPSST
jgi:hypothetical protein